MQGRFVSMEVSSIPRSEPRSVRQWTQTREDSGTNCWLWRSLPQSGNGWGLYLVP